MLRWSILCMSLAVPATAFVMPVAPRFARELRRYDQQGTADTTASAGTPFQPTIDDESVPPVLQTHDEEKSEAEKLNLKTVHDFDHNGDPFDHQIFEGADRDPAAAADIGGDSQSASSATTTTSSSSAPEMPSREPSPDSPFITTMEDDTHPSMLQTNDQEKSEAEKVQLRTVHDFDGDGEPFDHERFVTPSEQQQS